MEADFQREATPDVPVTTNLMGTYAGLDYAEFADVMDVISWDCYADVGGDPSGPAFGHALMRGLKGNRPWLLMEQTPSSTNWKPFPTLKPPGLMRLWSWQAVAHGSDSVMFFQWRRSRGAHEKFHGAVVAHIGNERPRVFREVAELGAELEKASEKVIGTRVAKARVGVLWDQQNRWAIEGSCGPGRDKRYVQTVRRHYAALWRRNIPVDVVRADADWSQYDILIAPMLYMVKSGEFGCENEAKRIQDWVASGGTFVATFLSGVVNENDLVYEGGYPGPLRELLGIWVEEIDGVEPGKQPNTMVMEKAALSAKKPYTCDRLLELLETEGAEVLARYGRDWYAGRPCLTRNEFGEGSAYYIGADADDEFLRDFYGELAAGRGIEPLAKALEGSGGDVEVLVREAPGARKLLFVLNHAREGRQVDLGELEGTDILTGERMGGRVELEGYGVRVVEVK